MEELLSIGDAARLLDVSTSAVKQWSQTGKLPTMRTAGGIRLFRREDVERVAHERRERRRLLALVGERRGEGEGEAVGE